MIEWNKGEPPRDGKWHLVLHSGDTIDTITHTGDGYGLDGWWNVFGMFIDSSDFEPDYWAEINLPDGYHIPVSLEEEE